jgi:hypothetical protein
VDLASARRLNTSNVICCWNLPPPAGISQQHTRVVLYLRGGYRVIDRWAAP